MQDIADRISGIAARPSVRNGPPLLLVGLLWALFTGTASAGPLAPPVTDAFLTAGGEGPIDSNNRPTSAGSVSNYTGFGPDSQSFLGTGNVAAGGDASISRTMVPGPFLPTLDISASAAVTSHVASDVVTPRGGTLGGYGASGYIHLWYQFEYDGPPGVVNLDFLGKVKAEGSGATSASSGVASAHIAIVDASGVDRVYDEISSFTDGEHLDRSWIDAAGVNHVSHETNYGFTTFLEQNAYAILANTTYTIDMAVSAGATTSAGYDVFSTAASGDAFADPYLSIDPSTPNAGAYTLSISPGIGNELPVVESVAEPETYALIMSGLGVVGLVSRRRRVH